MSYKHNPAILTTERASHLLTNGDVVYIHGACFLWVPIIILDVEISVVHLHHRVVLVILPQ